MTQPPLTSTKLPTQPWTSSTVLPNPPMGIMVTEEASVSLPTVSLILPKPGTVVRAIAMLFSEIPRAGHKGVNVL